MDSPSERPNLNIYNRTIDSRTNLQNLLGCDVPIAKVVTCLHNDGLLCVLMNVARRRRTLTPLATIWSWRRKLIDSECSKSINWYKFSDWRLCVMLLRRLCHPSIYLLVRGSETVNTPGGDRKCGVFQPLMTQVFQEFAEGCWCVGSLDYCKLGRH